MGRGAWQGAVRGVTKGQTRLKRLHTHTHTHIHTRAHARSLVPRKWKQLLQFSFMQMLVLLAYGRQQYNIALVFHEMVDKANNSIK